MKPSCAVTKLTPASGPRSTLKVFGRPGEPVGEPADADGSRRCASRVVHVAQPEVSDPVAVPVVPLAPAFAEVAGLPAAHADVPRLRDLLHACEGRVLHDGAQQRMLGRELMRGVAAERHARSNRNPSICTSFAQYLSESSTRRAAASVAVFDRIAAAGDVDVRAVVLLAVVVAIVDAAQAGPRTADALLGGVVVHDVEDHLEPRLMEELDHALELAKDCVRSLRCASASRMRREVRRS